MLLAATGGHRVLYDVLVGLHVACAVIGFGAVAISGTYGGAARRLGQGDAAEEAGRYFSRRGLAEWLVLPVPVFGAAALAVRPGGSGWTDAWVLTAAGIWLVAAGLLLGVVRPAEARIARWLRGHPAPTGARDGGARQAGNLLVWGAAACDVLFVAALALMVTQPA